LAQSLTKTPPDAGQALQVNARVLGTAHEQIVSILRSRLGQNHGDLLAVPKAEASGGIAWGTPLAGAVVPAAQLPEDERAKLQQRAERFLSEIRGLAQQLRAEGPAALVVAQMLEAAVQTPPGDWLYSVGGKPVLVMWGHAAAGVVPLAASPIATAAPVAAAPATPTAPVAAAAAAFPPPPPPVTPPPSPGQPWKRWLLWGLLALVLLALLLWGLKRCSDTPQADAGLAEQIVQAEARNKALEDELAAQRGKAPAMQCVPDAAPPPASAPEPAAREPAAAPPEAPASEPATAPPAVPASTPAARKPPPPPASQPQAAKLPSPPASRPEAPRSEAPTTPSSPTPTPSRRCCSPASACW